MSNTAWTGPRCRLSATPELLFTPHRCPRIARRPKTVVRSTASEAVYQGSDEVKLERVIIIGSGMAGLASAAALAPHFEEVVLVERDRLQKGDVGVRKGVGQYSMLHMMMPKGARLFDSLMPGYIEGVVARGGCRVSMFQSQWYEYGRFLKRPPKGSAGDLHSLCASRAVYEGVARDHVLDLPNVRLQSGQEVQSLTWSPCFRRITGVRTQEREEGGDLVVMAGGRCVPTLRRWLQEGNVDLPEPEKLDVGQVNASCVYRLPPNRDIKDMTGMFIVERPVRRGCIAIPIHDSGLFQVSVTGRAGCQPPSQHADFLEYLRSYPHPFIYDLVAASTPVTPLHRFSVISSNQHLEKVALPEGFVVLGDATAYFNPSYGQGMSVAAAGAELLASLVSRRLSSGAQPGPAAAQDVLQGLPREFQSTLANLVAVPWQIATKDDKRFLKPTGSQLTFVEWYTQKVTMAAAEDHRVFQRILELVAMLKGPLSLFAPDVSIPVLRRALIEAVRKSLGGSPAQPPPGCPPLPPTPPPATSRLPEWSPITQGRV